MKKIKRITCVINSLNPGGAERVMSVLCNEFVKRGIETTLIVRDDITSAYPIDERVKLIATSVKSKNKVLRNLKRNLLLRKTIKQSSPDVVVSFMTPMNLQVIFFTLGLHYPLVISERNDPRNDIKKTYKRLLKLLYPKSEGFVFQTEEAMSWFSDKIQSRSVVIPNPISDNLPDRKHCQSKKIVSVGRLTKQKNHMMSIDAFSEFSKNHPDYKFVIYGVGPDEETLKQYIAEKGMNGKIELAGFYRNIPDVISDAELFVMSSDYEGMPNALMEAMGIGIPCISTDCPCGGPRYLIEDGKNGMLIPVGDLKSLVNAMEKLVCDTELSDSISHEAVRIKDRLSSAKIAEQWIDYCTKVVNRGKSL